MIWKKVLKMFVPFPVVAIGIFILAWIFRANPYSAALVFLSAVFWVLKFFFIFAYLFFKDIVGHVEVVP